jgi:hypothetical protein
VWLICVGKRLAEMVAMRMLAEQPAEKLAYGTAEGTPTDESTLPERTPVIHPDLVNVASDKLDTVERLLRTSRMHGLAMRYGIVEVMRWKPQDVRFPTPKARTVLTILGQQP